MLLRPELEKRLQCYHHVRLVTFVFMAMDVMKIQTVFILFLCVMCISRGQHKQKRQIFREHISPDLGGRIPDSAFQPERISLNRLSQNGFFSHDGLHLQQRLPNNCPYPKQAFPSTYKVFVQMDNSNVAYGGKYFHPETVDTSYLKPRPVHFLIIPNLQYHSYPLFPLHSLQLFYESKGKTHSYRELDEVQILKKFAPYLETFIHLGD